MYSFPYSAYLAPRIPHVAGGERQAEELGAFLAAEMMFYAVASAALANEVDTITELSYTQFSLLEI